MSGSIVMGLLVLGTYICAVKKVVPGKFRIVSPLYGRCGFLKNEQTTPTNDSLLCSNTYNVTTGPMRVGSIRDTKLLLK
jgi:hypothetical protein